MILSDKVIAQSTLVISKPYQSGFLALLAKFDFAIHIANSNGLLICGLLPSNHLESPAQSFITIPARKTTLKKSPFRVSVRRSFKKRKRPVSTISSEVQGVVKVSDSSDINTTTKDMDLVDTSCDEPTNIEIELKDNNFNGPFDSSMELNLTSDLSSPQEVPFGFSLRASYSHPVLHPNLCRVWLTSLVPDGFWAHLIARIISDDRIKSVLSILLFTALKNKECTLDYENSDVPPLWKLSQKGFAIEYEKITLLQLKQVSNKSRDCADDKFTNQIELIVHVREIALVYKQNEHHKSAENVIRLATRILVFIEQHILEIGQEWFPGVISYNNHDKEVLSFVPCPSCLSRTNDQSTLDSASTNYKILKIDNCKTICFSLKDLLVAYAQPSRSITCPLHHNIHVQLLAPDMVSTYIT